MQTKRVVVLPYDPRWAADFVAIKGEITDALGDLLTDIHHVGSTSVEGLSAKPCIDLDVVIKDSSYLPLVIEGLSDIGYIHEGDLGIKGREAFRYTDKPHLMTHHLYVCPQDSEELRRHLVFRDFLRSSPEAREKYQRVKERAAAQYPDDIDGYMRAKSACIEELYEACGLKRS
jgi:GrpB-like predicted nucleotidyltransferase (UPF0157 family)